MTATPKGVLMSLHNSCGITRATRKQLIVAFVDRGITVATANRKIDELLDFGILYPVESTLPEGHEVYSCTWWSNPVPKIIEGLRLTDKEAEVMAAKGLIRVAP